MKTKFIKCYKDVFEPELLQSILKYGALVSIKKDQLLIDIGHKITTIPLVINGIIKILREDENADEMVLYFLESGNTCAVSLNCLKSKYSKIKGIAETDSEIISIPVEKAFEWMCKYKSWQEFVIDSTSSRLDEMIGVIDTLAFMNMDERLYKYLTDKVKIMHNSTLIITHKKIATDLNTSRVVISRLLKKLENYNKIKLYRNKIEVLN